MAGAHIYLPLLHRGPGEALRALAIRAALAATAAAALDAAAPLVAAAALEVVKLLRRPLR